MKWKISLLIVLLLSLSCLLFHCGRVNRRPVYAAKIEKGQGFKAEFDKKKGTVTIYRESSGPSYGPHRKKDEEGTGTTLSVPRRAFVNYDGSTGQLTVVSPNSGFVCEPGVSVMYGVGPTVRLGLDIQWGFYGRWGGVAGISGRTGASIDPRLYLGITFQPFKEHFTGTSLLVGIDNKKDVEIGLRLSF